MFPRPFAMLKKFNKGLFQCLLPCLRKLIRASSNAFCLLKVSSRSIRKRCEICSKLTIKTPEQSRSGIFIANFEHFLYLLLLFLIVDFEQINI